MLFFETALNSDKRVTNSMTLVGNNSVSANSLAYPAGSAAGDVAFYFDKNATAPVVVPTGYTSIVSNTTTGMVALAAYKILTASDLTANVTGSTTTGAQDAKFLVVFRPSGNVTNVLVSSINSESTTAVPSPQVIYTGNNIGPIISFFQFAGSASSPSVALSGSSPGYTQPTSGGNRHKIAYKITNYGTTLSVNDTGAQSDGGNNVCQSFYAYFN